MRFSTASNNAAYWQLLAGAHTPYPLVSGRQQPLLHTTPFDPLGVEHTIAHTGPIPPPGSKHRFESGKPQQSPFATQVPRSATHPLAPPAPVDPPVPEQREAGAHALEPLGCPFVVSSAQQPVAHDAFETQSGAHVPAPVPKLTQCTLAG